MARFGASSDSRKKRKTCNFCADKVDKVDYKDSLRLKRYITERGKILPRRITGNCAFHQRMISAAVKRSREAALIGFVIEGA